MSKVKELSVENFKLACISDDVLTDDQVWMLMQSVVLTSEEDVRELAGILHKYRPNLERRFLPNTPWSKEEILEMWPRAEGEPRGLQNHFMNTQKLITGIALPLVVVCTYVFISYVSWVGINSQIQHATSFCAQTPEYVNTFGMEQCRRFTENNITQFNIMKTLSVGSAGLVLILSIILSFLSFRQGENVPLDKKTKRLFSVVLISFALLLSADALVGGRTPLLTTAPMVAALILFGILLSVVITWGYAVYYFISSVGEKNFYKIILSLVIGALVSFPIMNLLSPLFIK